MSVPEPVIADNEKAVEDFTESTRQTIKNIMGSNDMNDVLEKIRSGTILLVSKNLYVGGIGILSA